MTALDNHVNTAPKPAKSLITKLNMGTGIITGVIFSQAMYWLAKSWFDAEEAI